MSRERERLNRHVDSMLDSPRREAATKMRESPDSVDSREPNGK
jgi:hypothetical protein